MFCFFPLLKQEWRGISRVHQNTKAFRGISTAKLTLLSRNNPAESFSLEPVFLYFRCNNENEWCQIHENIIRKSSTKYTAPSSNYGKYLLLHFC